MALEPYSAVKKRQKGGSVSAEQIPCVDLVLHIVKACIVAVGQNGLTLPLELVEIVDHHRAEEGLAILQRRLIDNDLCALGLDALHDALN